MEGDHDESFAEVLSVSGGTVAVFIARHCLCEDGARSLIGFLLTSRERSGLTRQAVTRSCLVIDDQGIGKFEKGKVPGLLLNVGFMGIPQILSPVRCGRPPGQR
jgi:hypothetical protein